MLIVVAGAAGLALAAVFAILLSKFESRTARALATLYALVASTVSALVRSSRPGIVAVALLSLSTHGLNVVAIYLLLSAVGVKIGLATCFVFAPTVLLLSMLPASLSGWGVREAALVLALGSFSVPYENVITASVLFGVCVLVASLPGAIIWLSIPSRSASFVADRFQASTRMSDVIKLRQ
jgi:uncharacterized membrane protein YbhN (UPF0104 family)